MVDSVYHQAWRHGCLKSYAHPQNAANLKSRIKNIPPFLCLVTNVTSSLGWFPATISIFIFNAVVLSRCLFSEVQDWKMVTHLTKLSKASSLEGMYTIISCYSERNRQQHSETQWFSFLDLKQYSSSFPQIGDGLSTGQGFFFVGIIEKSLGKAWGFLGSNPTFATM